MEIRRIELDVAQPDSDIPNPVFHYANIPSFQILMSGGLHSLKFFYRGLIYGYRATILESSPGDVAAGENSGTST